MGSLVSALPHGCRSVLRNLPQALLALVALAFSTTLPAQTLTYTGIQQVVPYTGTYGNNSSPTPVALAVDAARNRYIADFVLSSVVKLAPDGTQTSVGSNLSHPNAIAVDAPGNVYIVDSGNSQVVKVTPNGTQTTVASGLNQPAGVSIDALGNIFIAVQGDGTVIEVPVSGPQSVPYSGFTSPAGLAFDTAGNLYVADEAGSVYEIAPGGAQTQVGYNFTNPSGVAVDAHGTIYVADQAFSSGDLFALEGGAPVAFGVGPVSSVATDSAGNLYVTPADAGTVVDVQLGPVNFGTNNVCQAAATAPVPCSQSLTLRFALPATQIDAALSNTLALTQGAPDLDYTVTANTCTGDLQNGHSCTVTVNFRPLAPGIRSGNLDLFGSLSGAPALSLATVFLHGIGAGPLTEFDTGTISTLPLTGFVPGFLFSGVSVDALGNIYYPDYNNCNLYKFIAASSTNILLAGTGACFTSSGDGSPASSSTGLFQPSRTALDGRGDLYVLDEATIRKIDGVSGIITTIAGIQGTYAYSPDGTLAAGSSIGGPAAIAIDAEDNIYFSDNFHGLIRKIDAFTGLLHTVAGNFAAGPGFSGDGGLATAAQIDQPAAFAFDTSGNMFVAEQDNNLIREVSSLGVISTVAGVAPAPYSAWTPQSNNGYTPDSALATTAHFDQPIGIAVDPAGNLYVADSNNLTVRKIEKSTGIITTAAGVYSGGGGYGSSNSHSSGDGGPANLAGLGFAEDVALDSAGNIFIPVGDQHNIRRVTAASASLNFGSLPVGTSSPAGDVTVSNNGNAALDFTALLASSSFQLSGANTTCAVGTPLAPSADCIVGVQFAPLTAASPLDGTVTVTDNAFSLTQTISLSGTATFGPASRLALVGVPSTILAGGNLGTIHVDIEDIAGDLVTNSTAAVLMFLTGPGGFSQAIGGSAVNGVVTLNLSSIIQPTTGTYTLTATSATLSTAISLVTVTPAATKLALTGVPVTVLLGGHLGAIGVSVETTNGSVATSSSAPITLTITGPGGYSHTLSSTAASGLVTFNLAALPFTTAGTYTVSATSSGLATATATFTVNAAIVTSTVVSSSNLAPGFGSDVTLTATVSPAPAGSAPGTISFYSGTTLLGTEPLTASAEASLSASLPLGLDAVTAIYSGTAGYAASTSSALAISVRAATAISLAASPTTQLFSNPIVLSAQVASPTTGVFTGTITFLDEATVLATVPVGATGLASYSDTTLADGSHKLSASYSGDSDFDASTVAGTSIAITIADLNLSLGGDNNRTVIPGAAVTYNFPLSPLVTPTFIYEVALTASGLPPGATYTFSPATVSAGSGSLPVAFTVQTAATSARLNGSPANLSWYAWTIGLLLPLAATRRFRSRLHNLPFALTVLLLSLAAVAGLNGCGSGGFFGQATGQTSYTIAIHATSGSLVRTSTVQLHFE